MCFQEELAWWSSTINETYRTPNSHDEKKTKLHQRMSQDSKNSTQERNEMKTAFPKAVREKQKNHLQIKTIRITGAFLTETLKSRSPWMNYSNTLIHESHFCEQFSLWSESFGKILLQFVSSASDDIEPYGEIWIVQKQFGSWSKSAALFMDYEGRD